MTSKADTQELDARAAAGETVVPGGTGGKSLEAQQHLAEGTTATSLPITPFSRSFFLHVILMPALNWPCVPMCSRFLVEECGYFGSCPWLRLVQSHFEANLVDGELQCRAEQGRSGSG